MKKIISILSLFIFILASCGESHKPLNAFSKIDNTGDANPDKPTGLPKVKFSQVYREIIQVRCIMCHRGAAAPAGLDMGDEETAYRNLVRVASNDKPGVFRVSPGDSSPDSSYIMAKLIESGDFRKPPRMPFGGPYLSPSEIALMARWIEGEE